MVPCVSQSEIFSSFLHIFSSIFSILVYKYKCICSKILEYFGIQLKDTKYIFTIWYLHFAKFKELDLCDILKFNSNGLEKHEMEQYLCVYASVHQTNIYWAPTVYQALWKALGVHEWHDRNGPTLVEFTI